MKRMIILFFSISLVAQPRWDEYLDHEHIEERLATEKIRKVTNLVAHLRNRGIAARASHEVLLVTLESGLKGVFKKGSYHHGEVAAYRASKALGARLVPPTVYRTLNGTHGSLQFYIKAPKVQHIKSLSQAQQKVGAQAISNMQVFYYIFGQWDTHPGNQLIASYGDKHYLALIDNSGILHQTYDIYGGPTFTTKGHNYELPSPTGTEFPYDQVQVVPGHRIDQLLRHYTRGKQRRWLSQYDEVAYVIWNHRAWIQLKRRFRFTKTFYQDTLDAYAKLQREDLEYAWQDWAKKYPAYTETLIQLILDKRDEVLSYAETKGTIINNTQIEST